MAPEEKPRRWLLSRVLIIGVLTLLIVPGLALISASVNSTISPAAVSPSRPANVLADSTDKCVTCHRNATPGIVDQFGISTMARANVKCTDCHEVAANYPGATEHEGTYILSEPTPARCQACHTAEVSQFYASRHSLPAYVAYAGAQGLSPDFMKMYQAIPEGSYSPNKERHALYALEGPDVTEFACVNCHEVGKPQVDNSVGECQKCHLRHEFSLEQVRKPQTCNACHIGPDHPQWEIYQESPHGISFMTGGDKWNWAAKAGTLNVVDFPAPTCATCHFSGFGASGTTHDVGDRLTWYLFASVSDRRPTWQDNMVRMQNVCLQCHNQTFVTDFYAKADVATNAVNVWVKQSDAIMKPLQDKGLVTAKPFDQPIDYTYFELWHHWGRTAKYGVWMQGPDYTQWHGAYEVEKALAELQKEADDLLGNPPVTASTAAPTAVPPTPNAATAAPTPAK